MVCQHTISNDVTVTMVTDCELISIIYLLYGPFQGIFMILLMPSINNVSLLYFQVSLFVWLKIRKYTIVNTWQQLCTHMAAK